jgi:hypothetical protein
MSWTKTLIFGLAFCMVLVASGEARGLGSRGRSSRGRRRGARAQGTASHIQFNRPRSSSAQVYRRPPSYTAGRSVGNSSRSLLRRAGGEAFGYDARDSLTMGAGRRAARGYQSPRDQRVAQERAKRVVGFGGRVASSLRRILQP